MKTLISLLFVFTLSTSLFASGNEGLQNELNSWIKMPVESLTKADNQIVAVAIKVDESGKLEVTGINASSEELANYVLEMIESKELAKNDPRIGKEYYYRLNFMRL